MVRFSVLVAILCLMASAGGGLAQPARFTVDCGLEGSFSYPSLGIGEDGAMLCTFTRYRSDGRSQIGITSSKDGGTTWSPGQTVATAGETGYVADSTILVAPGRVDVYWTEVIEPYARSRFMAASKAADAGHFSSPRGLGIPKRYISGKVHAPLWLDDQTAIMGFSYDALAESGKPASEERAMYCKAGVLRSTDGGRSWSVLNDAIDVPPHNADEPAIARTRDGGLLMVIRTYDTHPWEAKSRDGGVSWSAARRSALAGYNAPTALCALTDGMLVRVWDNSQKNRFPLVIAASRDDGASWLTPRVLAEQAKDASGDINFEQASYPSVMATPEGKVMVVWQERLKDVSRIRGASLDPAWLEADR